MDTDQRHRLATMIDIALRDSTTSGERAAAIGAITTASGNRTIADLVKEMMAEQTEEAPVRVSLPERERTRPWREWKAEHEATVAECERLRRRVAILESARYEKMRPRPDQDGNIPYPSFLFALLAARDWQIRDALFEFAHLADIEIMEVVHWKERGKAPYYYYQMLDRLSFTGGVRERMQWTDADVAMLRGYYTNDEVLPDGEIAKDMSRRLGKLVSQWGVHCKAQDLGLLQGKRRIGRRLKTTKANREKSNLAQSVAG